MMLAVESRIIASFYSERDRIDFVKERGELFAINRQSISAIPYPLDPSFMSASAIPVDLGLSAAKTLKWLLNHHYFPSIHEGQVTFHAQTRIFKIEEMQRKYKQLQFIYTDKQRQIPHFYPFERKSEGSALGTIFKKKSSKPNEIDKKWMGKVGQPENRLEQCELTRRSRTKKEINLDSIREKLASDCYAVFGAGIFSVPKTRLSEQAINNWSQNKDLQQYMIPIAMYSIANSSEILSSLRIMSRFVENYTDFALAITFDEEEQNIPFMQFIEKWHRPPTHLLTPAGKAVPLLGIMEMIAVGRILADTDLLGGGGKNAGFVWVEENGEIVGAQTVKIDPGCAFNFTFDPNNSSPHMNVNWVLNTHEKLCGTTLKDIKDLQMAQQNPKVNLYWKSLTPLQRENFIKTLLKTSCYLEESDLLHYLFYRDGAFYKDDITELPLVNAQKFQKEMEEWLQFQLEIYSDEIEFFFQKYPKYYRDVTKATLPFYPSSKSFTERQIANSTSAILFQTLPIGKGYLVRQNLVLTTASLLCYENTNLLDHARIKEISIIFDYGQEKFSHYSHTNDQKFRIKKVIAHSFSQINRTENWALVSLDQKILGRTPLTLEFISSQNLLEIKSFSIVEKYLVAAEIDLKLKKIKRPDSVISPGFYILGKCLASECTTFNQPTWRHLGYGTFQWDEILYGSSCKLCNTARGLEVIDAGIYHSQYILEGELDSPKKATIHKTGSVSEKKIKTLDQEEQFQWDYFKITVNRP